MIHGIIGKRMITVTKIDAMHVIKQNGKAMFAKPVKQQAHDKLNMQIYGTPMKVVSKRRLASVLHLQSLGSLMKQQIKVLPGNANGSLGRIKIEDITKEQYHTINDVLNMSTPPYLPLPSGL